MRKEILLADCGVGLGAGLMYVFDPVYGRRHRALIRDKAAHAAVASRVVLGRKARDIGNRVCGLVAEAGTHFRCEQVSDETLIARVRSKMGRAMSRPDNVQVTASEGKVTLRGIVRSEEYDGLFRCVSKVRGVRGVENQLKLKVRHGATPTPERANVNGNGAHNGQPQLALVRLLAVVSVVGLRMLRRGLSDIESAHAAAR